MVFSPRMALIGWAVLGPLLAAFVTWLAMLERESLLVSGAVRVARGEEVVRCNAQRQVLAATLNAVAKRSVSQARDAAAGVGKTPTEQAEIRKLCDASASCRERAVPR